MKVLHFGAGNIGLGFIGKTLSESGFSLIFSDINQDLVDAINYYKEYSVRTIGTNQDNVVKVKNITAINPNNPKIVSIISQSDLITTSIGPNALDNISTIIGRGIALKIKMNSIKPLNIIACENKIKASSYLKKAILKKLSEEHHDYLNQYIGFVDCSIDTIIPQTGNDLQRRLFLTVEDFKEWIVNFNQFKGKIPEIKNMQLSKNLEPFVERKLFTLNTGHAVAAYLGLIKKYKTIKEAISDKKIHFITKLCMEESGKVLIKRYNFNKNEHQSYLNKIFFRFQNCFLSDNLERIARNPLQKLGKEERLIKPLLGAIEYSLPYSNLIKGIASVFYYYNEKDLESIKIFNLVRKNGIKKTLFKICGLSHNKEVVDRIADEYISIIKNI